MGYPESIEYLYGLRHHGIKLGLENTLRLLSILDNPERRFRSVHIAGTNGKGSTAAMIASLLREAGVRTGLFTSPHLVSFTERIQVDGRRIDEGDVVRLTGYIRDRLVRDLCPTFFEFVTVMAFLYFMEEGVQWAVVETGMGGRFDATNTIAPSVTVITSVGMDHREFLGETLPEIAYEKAGIIKKGVPLVLAPQRGEALAVILDVAEKRNAPVYRYGEDFTAEIKELTREGVRFDYRRPPTELKDLFVPLTGSHQAVNGAVAVKAVELVAALDPSVQNFPSFLRRGLQRTSGPGRCELSSFRGTPVLLDGAHNPDAARALAETIRRVHPSGTGLILVFGAMADKDTRGMLSALLPLAREVVFTAPSHGRAEDPERLLRMAREMVSSCSGPDVDSGDGGLCQMLRPDPIHAVPGVGRAIEFAARLRRSGEMIVVTGSFYTVGEAKEAMGERAVLKGLRE